MECQNCVKIRGGGSFGGSLVRVWSVWIESFSYHLKLEVIRVAILPGRIRTPQGAFKLCSKSPAAKMSGNYCLGKVGRK